MHPAQRATAGPFGGGGASQPPSGSGRGARPDVCVCMCVCMCVCVCACVRACVRAYYTFAAGMHAAVAAHVVAGMDDSEGRQLAEYRRRLRDQPDAVRNLHFGFMLLLCAVHQVESCIL